MLGLLIYESAQKHKSRQGSWSIDVVQAYLDRLVINIRTAVTLQ